MKDSDLHALLLQAHPPNPGDAYWEALPGRITRRITEPMTERPTPEAATSTLWPRWAVAALACGLVWTTLWRPSPPGNPTTSRFDPHSIQTCFDEIDAVFPGRLLSLVEDGQGLRMELSESIGLPSGPRIYLRICGPEGCIQFVTSSGHQIAVGDVIHDVLADGQGHVVVAGSTVVWTSARPQDTSAAYQIEAHILEPRS